MVRISACINNYNYGRYLGEAIDSVFAQTYPPLEVIVVDDGSTDGSADFVAETYGDRVRLIRSENLGQLSACRLGVRAAAGDFVAFLDADDRWEPHHLKEVAKRLEADEIDFVTAEKRVFGDCGPQHGVKQEEDRVLPCTTLVGLSGDYPGGETSRLTARKTSLRFLDRLPPEMLQEWKLHADDVIVLGTSIGGSRKLQVGTPSVAYRAHGQNGYFGRLRTAEENRTYRDRHRQMVSWLYDEYFPGMDVAEIVRRDLNRNTLLKKRNKRRMITAVWRCPASLVDKLVTTMAIWAKH